MMVLPARAKSAGSGRRVVVVTIAGANAQA